MSQVTLYGIPASSYVRTARWALGEKGVAYDFQLVELGSDAHRALHPWARVPSFRHGDLELHETLAIVRYVDEAFPGPALQPTTPALRAKVDQWISAINSYVYPRCIRDYALHYILPGYRGEQPDRAAIERGAKSLDHELGELEKAYAKNAWIVGAELTLADLFVGPILATLSRFPESQAVLERCPSLRRALEAMKQRDAYQTAQPA
jgi:glutathione S-transferase